MGLSARPVQRCRRRGAVDCIRPAHPTADGRAISTVFDTLAFVLLVGGAIAILAGATPTTPTTTSVAEETGDVLSTSTASVSYSWSATLRTDDGRETVTTRRHARGTYAELLAVAAVTNPTLGSRETTGTGESLADAVRAATRRVLPTRRRAVQVSAIWEPFTGSSLRGEVVVGETPPPDASVAAATATVSSGFPNVTEQALVASREAGYYGVANATAHGVIRGLFPPGPTAAAFHSEGFDSALVTTRYRRLANRLGVDVSGALETGNVSRANRRLARALRTTLAATLRERYDSPTAAARAIGVHDVTIVVRTWSP